jgi:hypothetical protein
MTWTSAKSLFVGAALGLATAMALGLVPPHHRTSAAEVKGEPLTQEDRTRAKEVPDVAEDDGDIPQRKGPTPAELNYRRHLALCPRGTLCPPVPVEIATDDARAKARAQQARLKFMCWEYSDGEGGNHLLSTEPMAMATKRTR